MKKKNITNDKDTNYLSQDYDGDVMGKQDLEKLINSNIPIAESSKDNDKDNEDM